MAFFNDPVLQPDHAARAVGLAVDIRERFKESRSTGASAATSLEIGIGIATGYATLGRIGFEGRYDYGAVGNAIILASRLSGEAAPGQILSRRGPGRGGGGVATESVASASSRASAGRCRGACGPGAAALRTARVGVRSRR